MTKDKSILIRNIYYMLSYSFQVLKQNNYKFIETEKFDHIENLFAEIISIGASQIIKRGLYREYINRQEDLYLYRGRLNINDTIKNRIGNKNLLACEYDELSVNNIFNKIIKTTIYYLLKCSEVVKNVKEHLKKIYEMLNEVDIIVNISSINWKSLKFHSNNKTYEMIINVCYFVIYGLIQSTTDGSIKVMDFLDEHMSKVYERFILEYYKSEYSNLHVSSSQIKWDIQKEEGNFIKFLPKMQSDILISAPSIDKYLIIDAKYYGKIMSERFNKETFHSFNLYQIYTYVNNFKNDNIDVSGMLLYAKTNEDLVFNGKAQIGDNVFAVKVLDLNVDFNCIKQQLNEIVLEYITCN